MLSSIPANVTTDMLKDEQMLTLKTWIGNLPILYLKNCIMILGFPVKGCEFP